MNRQRALKVVLALVGLVFSAGILPMVIMVRSVLIAFAAWSSFAHAAVMAVMSIQVPTARAEWLITALVLGIIGALLIVLTPRKHIGARDAAA